MTRATHGQTRSMAFIDPELLEHATPEERAAYAEYVRKKAFSNSPLDLMSAVNRNTRRWPHIEYLNEHMVALCEYRLYASGPCKPPKWFYSIGDRLFQAASYSAIPEEVDDFWGEHPDTGERVVYRLAIAMPPRHGKSFLVTEHFPIWYWIRYSGEIAFATYSDDFATEWGAKLRDFIKEHPELGITVTSKRADRLKTSHGEMRFVGPGGALTGTGFQAGIIDDPFKSQEDAYSQAERDRRARWYQSAFLTRKTRKPGGRIPIEIMMFTRWHEDDIAGRYAYQEDGVTPAPDWCVLRLPAVAEEEDPIGRKEGEALCPAVKTKAELEKIRVEDPDVFASLYQGRPSASETGVFPRFQYYQAKDHDGRKAYHYVEEGYTGQSAYVERSDNERKQIWADECVRFATVDLAATKNSWSDWSVFACWDFHRPSQTLFLIGMTRDRVESADHEGWLRNNVAQYPGLAYVGIEDKTFGQTLMQQVVRGGGFTVVPLKATTDKVARAVPYGQAAARGQVRLPKDAEWVPKWVNEHSSFPNATHDDMVDVGGYAWQQVLTMPHVDIQQNYGPSTMEQKLEEYMKRRERRTRNRWGALTTGRLGV